GADIVVADRSPREQASTTIAAVEGHGRAALFVQTDVADEASVRAMAEQAMARFGRVDILVNNAGIFTESLLEDMPVEDWDHVVATNLRRVPVHPDADRPDAGARRRADHQHRLAARPDRRHVGRALLREQGGRDRADEGAGPRGGDAGGAGERDRAGP